MTRILKYVSKYKGTLILGTISMFIVIGVDLCIPYFQQIFITLIKSFFGYGKEFLYDLLSTWVHADIKNDLFNHIQKLEFK